MSERLIITVSIAIMGTMIRLTVNEQWLRQEPVTDRSSIASLYGSDVSASSLTLQLSLREFPFTTGIKTLEKSQSEENVTIWKLWSKHVRGLFLKRTHKPREVNLIPQTLTVTPVSVKILMKKMLAAMTVHKFIESESDIRWWHGSLSACKRDIEAAKSNYSNGLEKLGDTGSENQRHRRTTGLR